MALVDPRAIVMDEARILVMPRLKLFPFFFASFALFSLLPLTVMAQDERDPPTDDRYQLVEIAGGALRIDRQTGEISECTGDTNGWVCRLSADDRLAYEAEINRLDALVDEQAGRIAALEDRLAAIREHGLTAPDASPEPVPGVSPRETLRLPSDEELDTVMDMAEEIMRRFFGMVQDLREDLEAQNSDPETSSEALADAEPPRPEPPTDTQ